MKTISILIADSEPIVRRGLRASLEKQPAWKVVAEAATQEDVVKQATQIQPDIAILNLHLPPWNGLDAAREISKASPATRVLLLAAYGDQETIAAAFQAGVRGYLLQSDTEANLVAAVKALTEDKTFSSSMASGAPAKHLRGEKTVGLTKRESQVMQLLAEGNSNKEVAGVLGISSRTAENHRARIMEKLGLRSFSELVRYAIRNRMIKP